MKSACAHSAYCLYARASAFVGLFAPGFAADVGARFLMFLRLPGANLLAAGAGVRLFFCCRVCGACHLLRLFGCLFNFKPQLDALISGFRDPKPLNP